MRTGAHGRQRAPAKVAGSIAEEVGNGLESVNAVANDTIDSSAEERIVDALLAKGRLKEADLGRARRLQEETGGSLLALLARLGLVSERDHAETCAEVLGLPLVSVKDAPELPPEGVALSMRFMKQFSVCPVGEPDPALAVPVSPAVEAKYWLHPVSTRAGLRKRLALPLEGRETVDHTYRLGWRRLRA